MTFREPDALLALLLVPVLVVGYLWLVRRRAVDEQALGTMAEGATAWRPQPGVASVRGAGGVPPRDRGAPRGARATGGDDRPARAGRGPSSSRSTCRRA